jgi:hypothetical protein
MITAAVCSSTASASALSSPNGTCTTSGSSGANGVRLAGWPVRVSAPIVRPWNAPSQATILLRPVSRDSFSAASTASAPELQNSTLAWPVSPATSSSSSASSTVTWFTYRFEVWPSVRICVVTASTTAGWAWPSALTAMPPTRSR